MTKVLSIGDAALDCPEIKSQTDKLEAMLDAFRVARRVKKAAANAEATARRQERKARKLSESTPSFKTRRNYGINPFIDVVLRSYERVEGAMTPLHTFQSDVMQAYRNSGVPAPAALDASILEASILERGFEINDEQVLNMKKKSPA